MKKVNNVSVQSFLTKRAVHSTALLTRSWRSFLLLFACLIGSVNVLAQVNGEIIRNGDFTFEVTNATTKEVAAVGCTRAGDVTIPATVLAGNGNQMRVTSLKRREGAYFNKDMTILRLPNTCKKYTEIRFNGVSQLRAVHLSESVDYVLDWVFGYYPKLEQIKVHANNPHFKDVDGVLYSKNGKRFWAYPAAKVVGNGGRFDIPETVTEFGGPAFRENKTLKHLHVPATVTTIHTGGGDFFMQCPNALTLTVDDNNPNYKAVDNVLYSKDKTILWSYPWSLPATSYKVLDECRELARSAVYYPRSLTSLDLNKVERLNNRSVASHVMTTLTIPSGVTTLDNGALECTAIQSYKVASGSTSFKSIDDVLFSFDKKTLIAFPSAKTGSYTIPEKTEVIARSSFRSSKLTNLTIASSVKTIKLQSFAGSRISTINYNNNVSNLETLEAEAFRNAWYLSAFHIPQSVKKIGDRAFENCTKLTSITVGTVGQDALLQTMGKNIFSNTNLTSFKFLGAAPHFQTIGAGAFAYLDKLETFQFPSSVRDIQEGAFLGCDKLANLNFPANSVIRKIGGGAFADCRGLKSVTLPKSLERIDAEAFRNCSVLENVTLTQAVGHVDPRAFLGCENLASIGFPIGENPYNKRYSTFNGVLYSFNKDTLILYPPALVDKGGVLRVPPTVKVIGEYSCFQNPKLRQVVIPQNIQKIEDRAFSRSANLESVRFLSETMFPVANIKHGHLNLNAFDETDGGGQYVANGTIKEVTLNVPENLLNSYKAQAYYKKFKAITAFEGFTTKTDNVKPTDLMGDYRSFDGKTATLAKAHPPVGSKTFVVSATITHGGKVYTVNEIADGAFEGANIEEVIIDNPNLTLLGSRAFITSDDIKNYNSNIKRIIFLSDAPPTNFNHIDYQLVGNQKPFGPQQKIHVKRAKVDVFKGAKNWADYASQISYTIEGVAVNNKYATFSREFDVDFDLGATSDLPGAPAVNKNIELYAGQGREMKGFGDHGTIKTEYKVSFKPIGTKGKNAYVPKETGVLIKNTTNNTTEKFYYRIGEKASATPIANNVLQGVTFKKQEITKSASNPAWRYYVLQGGVFRLVPNTYSKFSMNAQKAYLLLKSAAPAGAPDVLSIYEDEDITTGIDAVSADSEAPVYYNLQGVRTTTPSRGLYLRNGKKTFIH